jgi:hypothetical protein
VFLRGRIRCSCGRCRRAEISLGLADRRDNHRGDDSIAPPRSGLIARSREFAVRSAAVSQSDQHIVLGGRHIAGFVVIPDHEDVPPSVPALHFSKFIELFRSSYWESDFGPILNDRPPTPPFAFIMGLGPGSRFGGNIYVAPPAVLQMPHVCAWRFHVRNRQSQASHNLIFFDVTAADELPRAGQGTDLCPLWM